MSDNSNNLPATITHHRPPSVFSGEHAFEAAQRMAKALVASSLVPKEYQGNQGIPNAMIALEMSQRIGASPLAVMQNMHVIHGRPSWSSTFIIASLNSCGRFSPIRFEMTGTGDNQTCTAWATDHTGEKLTGPPVSIKMAKDEGWFQKNGSKWKTMPELMLRYRAAAFFGRLYAPDILMGMHAEDELQDMGVRDVTKEAAPALVTEVDDEPAAADEPAEVVEAAATEDTTTDTTTEDREAIKAELDKLGINYGDRQRTETLQQLLDEAKQSPEQQSDEPPPLCDDDDTERKPEPQPEPQQKTSGPVQLF